jgi:hypothetical protein
MPIVVLTTAMEEDCGNRFVVKNTGAGPALNTRTSSFNLDPKQTLDLHHRTVIGAAQSEQASLYSNLPSGSLRPTDLIRLLNCEGAFSELQIFTRYQGVDGTGYQTSHTIMLTNDKKDLRIEFNNFEKTGHLDSVLRAINQRP